MAPPALLLPLALCLASPNLAEETSRFPGAHNVIVLLADDVGVDLIGAYEPFYQNHPNPNFPLTTPAIDYLAETGLLFRNAWTNPACSPSRAQILTGKPAFRNGIGRVIQKSRPVTKGTGLQASQVTLPTLLRNGDAPVPYHTAALGKWHLADGKQVQPGRPAHPLGSLEVPWFHQYAGSLNNLAQENYNLWTKTFATSIDPSTDECAPPENGFCEVLVDRYATADTADDAIYQLRTMREPFFLYVAFNAVHDPLAEPSTPLVEASCHGGRLQGDADCTFPAGVPGRTRCMVQWLDNEVGRILCALEEGPEKPDLPVTIIFLGDNGTKNEAIVQPFVSSHGKGSLFEGGVKVPFIVKSPWVSSELVGSSTEALVSSTDLFATVAQLAGAPEPSDPLGLRDSVSFLRVLQGSSESVRKYVYAERFANNFAPTPRGTPPPGYQLTVHSRAIRNRSGFKLHQRVAKSARRALVVGEELFDLNTDPHELQSKIAQAQAGEEPWASEYQDLVDRLEERYPPLVTP